VRLTSRTGYGVLALFDLAYHGEGGRPVLARDIARRQAIPLRYLEQILHDLRQASLVDAKRGPGGGYALARPCAEVRLDEVVAALDGPADALFAFDGEDGGARSASDVVAPMWRDLGAGVARLLGGVTLASLVERAAALGVPRAPGPAPMYFI